VRRGEVTEDGKITFLNLFSPKYFLLRLQRYSHLPEMEAVRLCVRKPRVNHSGTSLGLISLLVLVPVSDDTNSAGKTTQAAKILVCQFHVQQHT